MASALWKDEAHQDSEDDDEVEEQEQEWDDMAIVRAFESALNGSKSKSKSKQPPSSNVKSAKPKANHAKPKPVKETSQPANTAPSSQDELYQAAYAQAYEQIQAQLQAAQATFTSSSSSSAYPAPSSMGSYANPATSATQYPASSPYYHGYNPPAAPAAPAAPAPPLPPGHHHGHGHMPFPSPPHALHQGHHAAQPPPCPASYHCAHAHTPASTSVMDQEALANVLLAWYQSGYYMGRYEAQQELKARGIAPP